jgi:ribA/ribD-fused uncharacterized protein
MKMIEVKFVCDKCGSQQYETPKFGDVLKCTNCSHTETIPTPQPESEYIFFWKGPLSQWAKSSFKVGEFHYTCAEQYMMHQKALLFGDEEIAKQIMQAGFDPKKHKELGRKVRNFNAAVWNKKAKAIVYEGSKAKYQQNPGLMQLLESTKGKVIVEASPFDRIWGIGLGPDDPNRFDKSKWKGTNWLGEVLTVLRQKLVGE